MANNKPTNESYFIMRLRNNGYLVNRIPVKFSQQDQRAWMVVIDPGGASLFATCYRNVEAPEDNYIEFYDGDQYIPQRFKLLTNSMETIIEWLNNFGVIEKTGIYNKRKPIRKIENSGEEVSSV